MRLRWRKYEPYEPIHAELEEELIEEPEKIEPEYEPEGPYWTSRMLRDFKWISVCTIWVAALFAMAGLISYNAAVLLAMSGLMAELACME